jgi:hypothetical protein
MQGPTDYQTAFPDPLEMPDFMVTAYADAGKLYWKLWGPLGEPAIRGIDAWAEMNAHTSGIFGKVTERGASPNGGPGSFSRPRSFRCWSLTGVRCADRSAG